MDLNFFKNKKITVFGLGLHGGGVGTVKFLAENGAKKIVVTDIKTKNQLAPSLEKLKGLKNVEYVLGQHRSEDFIKTDMVIKNPSVPWNNKHIKLALEKKIPVEMDSILFFKLCKNPIIGVTGTKGKTTVATLIYEILRLSGLHSVKVGVGQTSVLDKLKEIKNDSVAVFELSSWRLSALGISGLSPHIAVITNIFPDHLNYYKSMDSYIADKKNIFFHQNSKDWLIINNDDEILRKISRETMSRLIRISAKKTEKSPEVFEEGDIIYFNDGIDEKKLISLDKIKILGKHNVFNLMAAIAAAFAAGISLQKIKELIPNLSLKIDHRLEFVREVGGVKYYNDTAATIPEATQASLESFDCSVILIAGGTDKNLNFTGLADSIFNKTKGVVFLKGSATEKIIKCLQKFFGEESEKKFKIVDSMEKAVEIASQAARAGDVVMLSPGAASFGLFKNEFDRGGQFKEAVEKLKEKK